MPLVEAHLNVMTMSPGQAPPIDLLRAAALSELLGATRMAELLDMLRERLDAIAAAAARLPSGRDAVMASVHQSQGSAGSLGLNGLMGDLCALEVALAAEDNNRTVTPRATASALVAAYRAARDTLESHLPELRSRNVACGESGS